MLEKISVLTDFEAVEGAARTILTKGSDGEQPEEELTPEHARIGHRIDTEMGGSVMIPTIPELPALEVPENIIIENAGYMESRMQGSRDYKEEDAGEPAWAKAFAKAAKDNMSKLRHPTRTTLRRTRRHPTRASWRRT